MHGARYMWITCVPLAWLVIVTYTAALQKIFSPLPRVGFLAQAAQLEAALDAGTVAAAQIGETQTLIFNARLDAVVCGVFLVLVTTILVDSLRLWIGILRGNRPREIREAPFVRDAAALGGDLRCTRRVVTPGTCSLALEARDCARRPARARRCCARSATRARTRAISPRAAKPTRPPHGAPFSDERLRAKYRARRNAADAPAHAAETLRSSLSACGPGQLGGRALRSRSPLPALCTACNADRRSRSAHAEPCSTSRSALSLRSRHLAPTSFALVSLLLLIARGCGLATRLSHSMP